MALDIVDHKYDKPADMRHIELSPAAYNDCWPNRQKFWVQRRKDSSHVTIGFPEPTGFISREHDLDELIEALEELRDFESEE